MTKLFPMVHVAQIQPNGIATLVLLVNTTIANNVEIPCVGRSSISITLGNMMLLLQNVLHIPNFNMPLLSCNSHRHRHQGHGCSFVADQQIWVLLTFPMFYLEINNTHESAHCHMLVLVHNKDPTTMKIPLILAIATKSPILLSSWQQNVQPVHSLLTPPTRICCQISHTSSSNMDHSLISTIPTEISRKPWPARSQSGWLTSEGCFYIFQN
jgi:hypothetical protein